MKDVSVQLYCEDLRFQSTKFMYKLLTRDEVFAKVLL